MWTFGRWDGPLTQQIIEYMLPFKTRPIKKRVECWEKACLIRVTGVRSPTSLLLRLSPPRIAIWDDVTWPKTNIPA